MCQRVTSEEMATSGLSVKDYDQFCAASAAGDQEKALKLIEAVADSCPSPLSPSDLFLDGSDRSSRAGLPPVSPLYIALQNECFDVVRYLLTLCPQIVDHLVPTARHLSYCYDSETILHLACRRGYDEIIQLLLDHGALTEIQGCRMGTPLHIAAEHGRLRAAELLLDHGADVEARDTSGNTPLHVAAAWDSLAVVQFLLTRGADIRARAFFGEDVYSIAISRGAEKVLNFLCSHDNSPMFSPGQPSTPCPLYLLAAFPGKSRSFSALLERLIEGPRCPAALRVDALLISTCCSMYSTRSEAKFKDALRDKEVLLASCPPEILPSLPWYGYRVEVQTVREWERIQGDRKTEFYYQRCIILERCLGSSHPTTYHYMSWLIGYCLNLTSQSICIQPLQIRVLDLFLCREQLKLEFCVRPIFSAQLILEMAKTPNNDTFHLWIARMLHGIEIFLKVRDSHQTCTAFNANPTPLADPLVKICVETLGLFRTWISSSLPTGPLGNSEESFLPSDSPFNQLGHKFASLCSLSLRGRSLLTLALGRAFAGKTDAQTPTLRLLQALLEWGELEHINLPDPDTGTRPLHGALGTLGSSAALILLAHGAHLDAMSRNNAVFFPGNALSATLSSVEPFLTSPLPLMCQCSWLILRKHVPFDKLDLPVRVKDFIRLHDVP